MIYELKKLFQRKELWIVLGLTLLAILLLVLRDRSSLADAGSNSQKTAAYYDYSPEEALPLIERELEQLGSSASDINSSHYHDWRVLYHMRDLAKDFISANKNDPNVIRQMYNEMNTADSDFARRDLAHAIKLYNRVRNYKLADASSMEYFLLLLEQGGYFHYLYLLVLCTMLSPLFSAEYESGMYQILFSSKKGKAGLFRKKICGGLLCVVLFALIYTAFTFLLSWFWHGMNILMLSAALQSSVLFRNCPYALTFLDYGLLVFAMRAVIGAFVLALTALVSCFCKKNVTVFAFSGITAAVPILIAKLFENVPAVQTVLNRLGIMQLSYLSNYLTEYNTVNVFGFPIGQFLLSVLCTCLLTAFLLSAAYAFWTRDTRHRRI